MGDEQINYVLFVNTQVMVRFQGVNVSDAEVRAIVNPTDLNQLAEIALR